MEPNVAYVRGLLWLPKALVDLKQLKNSLTFIPATTAYQKKPEPIRAWAETSFHIGVPLYTFGSLYSEEMRQRWRQWDTPLVDERPRQFENVDIRSTVQLDSGRPGNTQALAADTLARHEAGIISLFCGGGKTVIALHAAARYRCPIVVVVDSKGLQEQWASEVRKHLRMGDGSPVPVGFVGDGRAEWDRPVVVALVQTLFRMADAKHLLDIGIRRRFGVAVYDEVHCMGAPHFGRAAPLFMGRRWGLSATPRRADGLERLYYLHLGQPVMVDLRQELKPYFYFYRVQTQVNPDDPQYKGYVCVGRETNTAKLLTYLSGLTPRTYEIVGLVQQALAAGRNIMVLSQRLYLLEQLRRLLPTAGVINGSVTGPRRFDILKTCNPVLCQFKLGEKALDKPNLDMLIVCEPFQRDAIFQQVIGRVQRPVPGKTVPIVVFVEDRVGPCIRACLKVKRLITGWPEEKGGPYTWRHYDDAG